MRRLLLALVAALALTATAGAGTASALVIGIADQKADMFFDERFEDLGIKHARLNVGWDVMRSGWQVAEVDRWMFFARLSGVDPLVSFGHSRTKRRSLPTPRRFMREFVRFRKRYPWVTTFATWNEANHCGEPTCHKARLVGRYYNGLRRRCKGCIVLAAELLDMPNMLSWVRRFKRQAKGEPRWWGLHNYVEANRFTTTRLRGLLRRVRGQVWLTEVGGLVKRRTNKKYTVKRIPESKWHALRVTRYIFRKVVPLDRRITRVYLYHWNSSTARDTWDSALVDHRGKRRPAFDELKKQVRTLERRAARRSQRRR